MPLACRLTSSCDRCSVAIFWSMHLQNLKWNAACLYIKNNMKHLQVLKWPSQCTIYVLCMYISKAPESAWVKIMILQIGLCSFFRRLYFGVSTCAKPEGQLALMTWCIIITAGGFWHRAKTTCIPVLYDSGCSWISGTSRCQCSCFVSVSTKLWIRIRSNYWGICLKWVCPCAGLF